MWAGVSMFPVAGRVEGDLGAGRGTSRRTGKEDFGL